MNRMYPYFGCNFMSIVEHFHCWLHQIRVPQVGSKLHDYIEEINMLYPPEIVQCPEKALRRLWPFAEKWCLVRQKGKSWKTTFSVFPAWFYFAQHGSWKQKMALEYGTYEQLQVWWEMGKSEDQSLELRIHFQSQTAQSNDCNFRGWGCWKSRWTRENQVEVLST